MAEDFSLQTRTSAIVMELTGGRVAWIVKAVYKVERFSCIKQKDYVYFFFKKTLFCVYVFFSLVGWVRHIWVIGGCFVAGIECYLLHRGLHQQGIIYKPDCVVEYSDIFCGIIQVYGKPSCTITDTFTNYEKGLWHPPSVYTIIKPIFVPSQGQLYCQFEIISARIFTHRFEPHHPPFHIM